MCCCGALYAQALLLEVNMTDVSTAASLAGTAVAGAAEGSAPSKPKAGAPLYAPREPIYPQLVRGGQFRRIKWAVMIVTLGIYYGLPWLRWDRGPGLSDQAVLFDFANERLHLFSIEIWAQEFYFLTGILITSALALFLITALAGRVWCGYACPQTVWTDLMIAAERLWQGDRNARMRLAKSPWTFDKIWRLAGTHGTWLAIGILTGGALVFYFRDAPTLFMEFWRFQAPAIAYVFLAVFAGTTYLLGGLAREQVCIYMCPWPRIQGAMFDADSLLITYRDYRGEPRGAHKKGDTWDGRGDCIDCQQCVVVCPAGIDIRNGPQLECIQCALCIDSCDAIMAKVGRPPKLIAYDTIRSLEAGAKGQTAPLRLNRPRTVMYATALAIVAAAMLVGFSRKTVLDLSVLADRNPLYVLLKDGSIRNGYTLQITNKRHDTRSFALTAEGLPQAKLTVTGADAASPLIEIKPSGIRSLKVYITVPPSVLPKDAAPVPLTFRVRDMADGTEARHATNFRGPQS
jgi:cytochrome c oxidase accessory protein FixG